MSEIEITTLKNEIDNKFNLNCLISETNGKYKINLRKSISYSQRNVLFSMLKTRNIAFEICRDL